jgi:hypothetical protein
MTRFFLEHGADISKNSHALKIAKDKGHFLIFKLLEQHKLKVKLEIVKPEIKNVQDKTKQETEIITKQDVVKQPNDKDVIKHYKEYLKIAGVVIVLIFAITTQIRLVNLEHELMVVKLTQLTNQYQK